jgi:2,5-diamino-6-(ribosylamino)-4(3H)-pyrimidinone 5'-phosphate reductase
MSVSILTAVALNGIITPARGTRGENLVPLMDVPPDVWRWRAEVRRRHDAVCVGTNTVRVDDPALTSHVLPENPAVRVTIDPAGKIAGASRFFDGSARTLVGISETTPREYRELLEERGVEAVVAGESRIDLRRFLDALAERGLARVVVEGGGTLNRSLLSAGLVDRLYLMMVPAVLDAGSVNLFEGNGKVSRFRLENVERVGDFLMLTYRSPVPLTSR